MRTRTLSVRLTLGLVLTVLSAAGFGAETRVAFDIPSRVECRDITPEKCAATHPTLKLVEAKFRISATFVEGTEESTSDFIYMISSPYMRMRVLDFLPNTTLESTTADDRIEVIDSTESTDATTGEARVGYSVLSLRGSKNLTNRKSESNHYQRIAPKNLVLASGTVNRGHGVFYKLRPSQGVSLEGSKEFVLMCIVPKTWRGDWCSVICMGRATKKTAVSSSVAVCGIEHAHVGMYLLGEQQASELSEQMTDVQNANGGLLARYLSKQALHTMDDWHPTQAIQLTKSPSSEWYNKVMRLAPTSKQTSLDEAKASLLDLERRLGVMSGKETVDH